MTYLTQVLLSELNEATLRSEVQALQRDLSKKDKALVRKDATLEALSKVSTSVDDGMSLMYESCLTCIYRMV